MILSDDSPVYLIFKNLFLLLQITFCIRSFFVVHR